MLSMVETSLSSARKDDFICCQCIFAVLSLSSFGNRSNPSFKTKLELLSPKDVLC